MLIVAQTNDYWIVYLELLLKGKKDCAWACLPACFLFITPRLFLCAGEIQPKALQRNDLGNNEVRNILEVTKLIKREV